MLLLLVDIATREVRGIFDHLGASFSKQLNAPGSASVTLALDAAGYGSADWRTAIGLDGIGCAKTFAYLVNEANGDVDWWGVVWSAPINVDERTVTLRCGGVATILAARAKRADTSWVTTEQATIVSDLLTEAQTGTRRDLYISHSLSATGITRSWLVLGAERHYFDALISEVSELTNGFDFRYDAAWTGGGDPPTHSFALLYPAPRTTPVTTLIATGNISITSWEVDGTTVATDVDVTGNQIVVTRSQTLASYPGLDRSVSRSSENRTANLEAWGDRTLAAATKPRQSGTFRALLADTDSPPAQPGDAVRLIETDLIGIDGTYIVTDMRAAQAGTGRIVDYALADPTTLVHTSELR